METKSFPRRYSSPSNPVDPALADSDFTGVLRVVFEEGLLVFQVGLGWLHFAGDIGDARHERMVSRRGPAPHVSEQLPGVLAAGGRIQFRRLPRAVIHADFDRLERRPVIQYDTEPLVPAAFAGDASDERLQLHVGDRLFLPLRFAVDRFAPQRAVPAGLELADIGVFLKMDAGEPFDLRHSVPARNEQAKRG